MDGIFSVELAGVTKISGMGFAARLWALATSRTWVVVS